MSRHSRLSFQIQNEKHVAEVVTFLASSSTSNKIIQFNSGGEMEPNESCRYAKCFQSDIYFATDLDYPSRSARSVRSILDKSKQAVGKLGNVEVLEVLAQSIENCQQEAFLCRICCLQLEQGLHFPVSPKPLRKMTKLAALLVFTTLATL